MVFEGFELGDFWEESEYSGAEYVEAPPTEAIIASVEAQLGYKLPASYVALMRTQNGGYPRRTAFPTTVATSWAPDHVAITTIFGIGHEKIYALCGELGSKFMLEEWGYPAIGVCICDCPSAGHDLIMLDYRACGPEGEPAVVHVDQERDYAITHLADTFEAFVRGLVDASVFEPPAAEIAQA